MSLVGKKAPTFTLEDQNGTRRTLKDFSGKPLLIYFYPKDATPGCTIEAHQFKKAYKDIQAAGVEVVGVSKDSVRSHKKFCEAEGLPFTLLADPEKKMIEKYGVLKEKSMFGKKYMGVSRESFLIDANGKVVKHYEQVKPAVHAKEVLKDAKELL